MTGHLSAGYNVTVFRAWLRASLPADTDERIKVINEIRQEIHEVSPFRAEPVDLVQWVAADDVQANDYNPNAVAPPEMELLRLSIMADGYTQPIVTNATDDARTVIDGFHRNRVGKECDDVRERVHGYLPVVQINGDRTDRGDQIAATIRHNRARGKHEVMKMADIVMELKRRNWSDKRVGKELGMEEDEVLRLTQITGIATAFADRDFSQAWEHVGPVEDDPDPELNGNAPVDLEWMRGMAPPPREAGWHDRTEKSSVLYGANGGQRGATQRSRFTEGEWFWYAYTKPPVSGRAEGLDAAKAAVEVALEAVPE